MCFLKTVCRRHLPESLYRLPVAVAVAGAVELPQAAVEPVAASGTAAASASVRVAAWIPA